MKTTIFYESTVEMVAEKVDELLGTEVLSATDIDRVKNYDFVIFATSTWGMGELQDGWHGALGKLKGRNLSRKRVGFVVVGAQFGSELTEKRIKTWIEMVK